MTTTVPLSLAAATQLLKSLSDESRLRIVHLLLRKFEMCVSDLEVILDFTQTKTSRHLTYLKNAGLVSRRKLDQRTFYTISEEMLPLIEQLFSYVDTAEATFNKDLETYQILYATEELAISRIHKARWEAEKKKEEEVQKD
ncbi:MAG: metalloregulator ArsR/SmtB family transcription factor [Bacteroidota bacterium]